MAESKASVFVLAAGEVQRLPASECKRLREAGEAISTRSKDYKIIKRLSWYTREGRAVLLARKMPVGVPKNMSVVVLEDYVLPLAKAMRLAQDPGVSVLVIDSLKPFIVKSQLPRASLKVLLGNAAILHGYTVVYLEDP